MNPSPYPVASKANKSKSIHTATVYIRLRSVHLQYERIHWESGIANVIKTITHVYASAHFAIYKASVCEVISVSTMYDNGRVFFYIVHIILRKRDNLFSSHFFPAYDLENATSLHNVSCMSASSTARKHTNLTKSAFFPEAFEIFCYKSALLCL